MVFDLGAAMRKKEEFESARLLDFEFRRTARATRLLATVFSLEAAALVSEIAKRDEHGVLKVVSERANVSLDDVIATYQACLADAHRQLVAERGDPTPYRLG